MHEEHEGEMWDAIQRQDTERMSEKELDELGMAQDAAFPSRPRYSVAMPRAYCKVGLHFPEHIIADGGDEIGILCTGYGKATNRYADGVVGVSQEAAQLAEEDESPVCAEHPHEYIQWIHPPIQAP